MKEGKIERFLNAVVEWAESRPGILAVALVGPYARGTARPDSDVDLVIITVNPAQYLSDVAWTSQFGEPIRYQSEDYGLLTSLRVWYSDGLEVEYGITNPDWAAAPLDEGSRRVISDGMQILFERGNILSRHQPAR